MVKTCLFFAACFLSFTSFTCALEPNRLVIPAYFFPTEDEWDTLLPAIENAGLDRNKVFIILNANNGVIGDVPPEVQELWKNLAQERVKPVSKVLCYVNLCDKEPPFDECGESDLQGARPAEDVLGYVDDWIAAIGLNNIDGFFLDDTPMDGTNKDNILEIINGIKEREVWFKVITNPGVAATDIDLLEAVDATIYDEGFSPDSTPPPKTVTDSDGRPFGRRKFAMILNTVIGDIWMDYVETAEMEGYGYFYATSGAYNELPPYLDDLLARIAL